MAEVSSNSTVTSPYLPPRKKARMEEEGTAADPFKPVGSLTFRIDNFREFSNSPPGEETSMRHCDTKVSVRGLTFGLAVYPNQCVAKKDPTEQCICMGLIVKCENASECNVNGDGSWSCLASMTFRVKTIQKLRADHVDEFTHRFFSDKQNSSLEWYDAQPLRFDFLMNPKYDLYNVESDSLELIVEISADAPVGVMELPKTDSIQVNEETVEINKSLLALHSRYFHSLFYNAQFDEGKSGECKVTIEAPATVEHFKRMLDTMWPMNRPLDDECIEGVLHLANQFLVTIVEGKCLEFLTDKSKKSALFKYRVADKYGCTALKKHVLRSLKITDFERDLFRANITEFVQLGPGAAEALLARYDALFISESDEEEDE